MGLYPPGAVKEGKLREEPRRATLGKHRDEGCAPPPESGELNGLPHAHGDVRARPVVPELGHRERRKAQRALGSRGADRSLQSHKARETECVTAGRDLRAQEPGALLQADWTLERRADVCPGRTARMPLHQHDVVPVWRAVWLGLQGEQVGRV